MGWLVLSDIKGAKEILFSLRTGRWGCRLLLLQTQIIALRCGLAPLAVDKHR